MTNQQSSAMIHAAATRPREREADIARQLRQIDHNNEPTFRAFGLTVDHRPVQARARMLDVARIQYFEEDEVPRNGSWNKHHTKRVYERTRITSWCVQKTT